MEIMTVLYPLAGGALIGLAVTLMLLFNGRVTGISGIIASSLSRPQFEGTWRLMFLVGLITGGLVMNVVNPDFFQNLSSRSALIVGIAGFLVGYGTVMGSGCTSGHGVCGISRLSVRSITATIVFMGFGFLTVQIVKYLSGGAA